VLSDEQWARIEPLLPSSVPQRHLFHRRPRRGCPGSRGFWGGGPPPDACRGV